MGGGGQGNLLSIHSSSEIASPRSNAPDGGTTIGLIGVAVGLFSVVRIGVGAVSARAKV